MDANDVEYRLQAVGLLKNIILTPRRGVKLTLLLDLDNTLIHCRRDLELNMPNAIPQLLQRVHCSRGSELLSRELFGVDIARASFNGKNTTTLLVKVRPFAQRFLRELHEMFHIRMVSKGHREYVEYVLDILDPEREILARGDSICMEELEATGVEKVADSPYDGKNKFIDQCLESISSSGLRFRSEILIIDDTDSVWVAKEDQAVIIKVDRYMWLDANKARLGIIAGGGETECTDNDEQLLRLIDPIKRVYDKWLDSSVDVTRSLSCVRREIMQGAVIAFSGLRNELVAGAQGYQQIAEELGARVVKSVDDPDLTHLIAKKNTEKVKRLHDRRSVACVYPLWITSCWLAMSRCDVSKFDTRRMAIERETGNFICPYNTPWEALGTEYTLIRAKRSLDRDRIDSNDGTEPLEDSTDRIEVDNFDNLFDDESDDSFLESTSKRRRNM